MLLGAEGHADDFFLDPYDTSENSIGDDRADVSCIFLPFYL